MTAWLQIGILVGVAGSAFMVGWNWHGAIWEAKYREFENQVVIDARLGEEKARQIVTKAYEQRLKEAEQLREQSEWAAEKQAEAVASMQKQLKDVRTRYQESLSTPACEEWAAQPIGCEINEASN